MLRRLLDTQDDKVATLLRLALGIVMFPHGAQKVLGWFGGHGFSASMNSFTQHMGIPVVLAFLAILAEFAGSLGLLSGLLTRVAAFGIAVNMAVAVFLVHASNGFFMNWFGNQKGEGIEYHILAVALAIAITIKGGGAYSVDRSLRRRIQ